MYVWYTDVVVSEVRLYFYPTSQLGFESHLQVPGPARRQNRSLQTNGQMFGWL